MGLYKYYPVPSDRMGALWALSGIRDAFILEFGPSGNTSFESEGFNHLNAEPAAQTFSTHISQSDITFGSTDRLHSAIKEVDARYGPDVIFILASSLAAVTGTDTVGICHEIQPGIGATLLVVDAGGFKGDYTLGIRNTLKLLCSDIVKAEEAPEINESSYNILGSQPDYYNYRSDLKEIQRLLRRYFHLACNAAFTSRTSLHDIQCASNARFNLVMRSEALDAAEILQERFGQEFIIGRPYGKKATTNFLETISKLTGTEIDPEKLDSDLRDCEAALGCIRHLCGQCRNKVLVSGNRDLVFGMGRLMHEMGFKRMSGIINHEIKGRYFSTPANPYEQLKINPGEEEKEDFLRHWEPDIVLGDGVLLDMLPSRQNRFCHQVSNPNISIISFFDQTPYIGFSGVIYLCEILCNGLTSKRGARIQMGHGGRFAIKGNVHHNRLKVS